MNRTLPAPICQTFLVCRKIRGKHITLLANSTWWVDQDNPKRLQLAFFARLMSGHGNYTIAVHLEDNNGNVLCHATSPYLWCPPSPFETMDLTLNLDTDFPGVGDYLVVLTANGVEISQESLFARLPQTEVNPYL